MKPRELREAIARLIAQWPGGGCSRDELARACGTRAGDPEFRQALRACYARHGIDFVRGYVVAPARPGCRPPRGPREPGRAGTTSHTDGGAAGWRQAAMFGPRDDDDPAF